MQRWLSHWQIVSQKEYLDNEGRNSRHHAEQREDFQELKKDVAAGCWDVVVIDSQWRFGTKHSYEWGEFANFLIKHGVELWATDEGWLNDPDDLAKIVTTNVNAAGSRTFQKKLSHDIQRGRQQAALDRALVGSNVPFGFDVGIFGQDGKERWRVYVISKGRY